jgi:tRNA splicing ligase
MSPGEDVQHLFLCFYRYQKSLLGIYQETEDIKGILSGTFTFKKVLTIKTITPDAYLTFCIKEYTFSESSCLSIHKS